MLWQSVAPTILSKQYDDYNSGQEAARRADARKRIAFYEDNQFPYIFEELSKYFSEPEKLKICFVNLCKKIVNSLAMVYMQDAKREIEGTDRDKEIFECGAGKDFHADGCDCREDQTVSGPEPAHEHQGPFLPAEILAWGKHG